MLVLQRKEGERIFLNWRGMRVVLTFVGFRGGNKIALGVEAPDEVVVMREEVQRQIERGEAPGRGRA